MDGNEHLYQVLKIRLKTVVKDNESLQFFQEVVEIVDKSVSQAFALVKLFVLHTLEATGELLSVSENLYQDALSVVSQASAPQEREVKSKSLKRLREFFQTHFKPLLSEDLVPHLPGIALLIQGSKTKMITAFNNNIQEHFTKRLEKLLKLEVIATYPEYWNSQSKGKKTQLLREVREALLTKTEPVEPIQMGLYSKWSNLFSNLVWDERGYRYSLKSEQGKFLGPMIKIAQAIESLGGKRFSCFPLKQGFIPGFVRIETDHVRTLGDFHLKKTYLKNLKANPMARWIIWGKYLDLKHPIFKLKKWGQSKYRFSWAINTDGITCDVIFQLDLEKQSSKLSTSESKFAQLEPLDLAHDIPIYRRWKIPIQPYTMDTDLRFYREYQSQLGFMHSIPKKIQKGQKEWKPKKLKEQSPETLEKLKDSKKISNDPGKMVIAQFSSQNKRERLRYTKAQRDYEAGFTRRSKRLNQMKTKEVREAEEYLSQFVQHAQSATEFSEWIRAKSSVHEVLDSFYLRPVHREMRFSTYLLSEASYLRLVREIKRVFGADVVILYGDWSENAGFKGGGPTPNRGLQRRLSEYFTIYEVDEWGTSRHCSGCNKPIANKVVRYPVSEGDIDSPQVAKDGKGKNRKGKGTLKWTKDHTTHEWKRSVYRVLECKGCPDQTRSVGVRWLHRDINGALNILKVGLSVINGDPHPFRKPKPKIVKRR